MKRKQPSNFCWPLIILVALPIEIDCKSSWNSQSSMLGWKEGCSYLMNGFHTQWFFDLWRNKMWLPFQCKYWSVPIPLSVLILLPEDINPGLSIIITLPLTLKQCLNRKLALSLSHSVCWWFRKSKTSRLILKIFTQLLSKFHVSTGSRRHMFIYSKGFKDEISTKAEKI